MFSLWITDTSTGRTWREWFYTIKEGRQRVQRLRYSAKLVVVGGSKELIL